MEAKSVKVEDEIERRATAKNDFEKSVRPFIEKSLSDETRRAYGRVIKELFSFQRNIEPVEIKRSLFEYLKAGGFIQNNPALSKLVTPPKLSEDLRGRALTVKEVNYILSGLDREKPEEAREIMQFF